MHIQLRWKFRPISEPELVKLIWFAGDSSLVSPVYGYYDQTWIKIKKENLGKSSALSHHAPSQPGTTPSHPELKLASKDFK